MYCVSRSNLADQGLALQKKRPDIPGLVCGRLSLVSVSRYVCWASYPRKSNVEPMLDIVCEFCGEIIQKFKSLTKT